MILTDYFPFFALFLTAIDPSKNSITAVPKGSPRFENICQCFIINPSGPLAS